MRALDQAIGKRRIVWVTAPPGAGKTVLVSSWLAARRIGAAWLQLDSGDGVATDFFHYLRLAMGDASSGLPSMAPERLADSPAFARQFFRALGAARGAPRVVVLDDYQELPAESAVHGLIAAGVSQLVGSTTVIVLSRAEPPPELARLDVQGAVARLGPSDLLLTRAETAALTRLLGGRRASSGEVERLVSLARGWAAGLVLLVGAREDGRQAAPTREFLGAEVVERLRLEERLLLVETSFLTEITPDLGASLAGQPGAGAILEALAARGWFVTRLASSPVAYRVHPLLRETLLERWREAVPSQRRSEQLSTAARRLEAAGQPEVAVDMALAAGAWHFAAGLVSRQAPGLLGEGRSELVARWIGAFPHEIVEQAPWLTLWLALARFPSDPTGALVLLERAYSGFDERSDADGLYVAWAAVVEGLVFQLHDLSPLDRWLAELTRIHRRFPALAVPEIEARVVAGAVAAMVHRQPGHPTLDEWVTRAHAIVAEPGKPHLRLLVGRSLAFYQAWWAFDLRGAPFVLDTLRPLAERQGDPATVILWHVAAADHRFHVGDLVGCRRLVDQGLRVATETGVHFWDSLLFAVRAWAALQDGDLTEADRAVGEMASRGGARLTMATFHYTAGILARRRGDLELAREHGRAAVRLAVDAGMPLGEASFRLAAALAEPQDTAARELAVALRLASEGKCHHIESICRAALSLEAARGGDEDGIRQHLTAAVSSMSDSGLMQLLWFSPEEQAEICALALERGIQPVWASAFTRRWRLAPPDRPLAGGEWPCGTRIRALGGLAVERDAKPVGGRKAPKKVLELLRRLILRGKAGARVEHLAEALWPDADGDAAAHALETTVYRLRRLLGGPDTITLRDGRIALSASAVCVDAWELDEVLNRIEAARARRADADVGHLQDLARRRSCGPLFGDDDDPDATEARRRLEQRMARLVGEASQLSPSP